ncbi:MAG TPA: DUF881 domain-containing protein [Streptomyces sp.]|jgi:uncharacterized protein YlxW (UPF0749 family)|nr:DUF881 domain-containing protein [Streptomyces sp.]
MSDDEDKKHPGELPPEESTAEGKSQEGRAESEEPNAPEESHRPDAAEGSQPPGEPVEADGRVRDRPETSETLDAQEPAQGEQKPLPPPTNGGAGRTGRQRLAQAVWPPRVTRAQLIVALLLFVLGLGLAIQVRSTSENSSLRGARQEDLVRILDELDGRTKRLEDEKQNLESQRTELENSSDQAEEARKQTRQKARQLGVLAGTVGAQGPGIELTVTDPGKSVEADMLLDAVQELRAAGAEAIEINNVRVVASTYFSDSSGGVRVDGHKISQPYRFQVIGKPQDLEPALNIPGGVVQTLRKEQAEASVTASKKILVDALRSVKRPDYAKSSSG